MKKLGPPDKIDKYRLHLVDRKAHSLLCLGFSRN
jgi:hypothetical protein